MARKPSVTGGKEARAALRALVAEVAGPLSSSSKKALAPIRDAAEARVRANGSVVSGELANSLVVKPDRERSTKLKPVHVVGPDATSPAVRVAHLVEFGVAPHHDGRKMHPGAEAKPFLRPAFEEGKVGAVEAFAKEIGPALERQADRLAKRAAKRRAKG